MADRADHTISRRAATIRAALRFVPLLAVLASCAPAPPAAIVAEATPVATIAPTLTPLPPPQRTSAPLPLATITPQPTATPPIPQPTPTLTALSRSEREVLFDDVWRTVANHYLYADFSGVNWDELKSYYRPRALQAPTSQAFYATLKQMVDRLNDRHSRFETPQEAFVQQALASGTDVYIGIGIRTLPQADGLLVTTVFPDSPALEAGIRRRDMIVRVDGQPVAGSDVAINGPSATSVELTVRRPDGPERVLRLQRRAVIEQIVPEAYVLPDTRVGYLLIQSLWAENMAQNVTFALDRLLDEHDDRLDGLVIDLRGNGGGWRSVLEGVLSSFVTGEVGTFYSQDHSYPLVIEPNRLYRRLQAVPVIVLVDGRTESYAEVLAAVLQSSRQARVIGVATAGNTETIFAYDFEDGSRLWVAQEGFRLPSGANLEGNGVQPDRTIDVDWIRFSEAHDPQISAALQMIGQGQAGRQ